MVEQFTYAQLRVYLTGEKGKGKRVKGIKGTGRQASGPGIIESGGRRDGRGADEALLDLIDQIKDGIEISASSEEITVPGTFDEIDNLFAQIYAGNASKADKKTFLSALYQSEHFYQRVLLKLGQLVPVLEEELLPSLADIRIQSDEQILDNINLLKSEEKPRKIDLSYKIPIRFWEHIKEILTGQNKQIRRLVYAASGFILLLTTVLGGLRFYHTTYQIILAENLLKENYRIYMADTPRLSGGYGSTGVAQLMGSEDENTYLGRVAIHLSQAQAHASESGDLTILQARLYLINDDLLSAEKEFDQVTESQKITAPVLNDLGVLEFKKGNYKLARSYFTRAIEKNVQFSEGYYNLALSEQKLGLYDAANRTMEKMVTIETDEGWQQAAQRFLKKDNQ